MRARGEFTEIDVNTVAGISGAAVETIAAMPADGEDPADALDRRLAKALTAARIVAADIGHAGLSAETRGRFLLPAADLVLTATNLPIPRTEFGEAVTGQLIAIVEAPPDFLVSKAEAEAVAAIAPAMTRDGYPGQDAFAELLRANAELESAWRHGSVR